MLDFDVTGLNALQRDLKAFGELPNDTMKKMVDAQAEVTEDALVYTAGTMLQGPYFQGDVARSVKRQKPKITKSGATSMIKFTGMQHGNRNGEVAFVNEYGKKSQKARPFIKTAIKESSDPAADAAREVLNDYLDRKNL